MLHTKVEHKLTFLVVFHVLMLIRKICYVTVKKRNEVIFNQGVRLCQQC